jgi:GNAT superfamily N-acetyltransferase
VRSTVSRLEIRPYEDPDEAAVLELIRASLGGGPTGARSAEFFRWKHMTNVFGRSLMLVAETEDRILGFRAFMRWRFRAGNDLLSAVRAVDTATHPGFQGRGIFTRLTLAAVDQLREDTDLIFNTPNEKSLPGYLKMGWSVVGDVPIQIRIRRPVRFVRGVGSLGSDQQVPARPAAGARADEALARWRSAIGTAEFEARLQTPVDLAFLNWRYSRAPELDYRAIASDDGRTVAVFRIRPRGGLLEATVSDLLGGDGVSSTGAATLRRVGTEGRVDHLTCSFASGSAAMAAARRALFIRSPRGMTLVANPLRRDLPLDVTELRNWAPVLGDLEVF